MRHFPSSTVWCAVLAGIGLMFTGQALFAAQVTLTWDPVGNSRLQGYKIYSGTGSRKYATSIDVKNVTTYTVSGLNDGTNYYFAVTAYASSEESTFSDEVAYAVPRSCTYSLSPSISSFAQPGGTGNVTVSAPAGCPWNASTPPNWLTLTSGATGTGNGTVIYLVAANNSASSRAASFTVAGQVFTVSEAGLPQYAIAASAGTGGLISPSGAITVVQGGGQSFAVTANPGYHISNVQVDGNSIGGAASYAFSNVTTGHSISATFAPMTYTISASASPGGKISPSGAIQATYGANLTFSISRYPGYKVADVRVDGVSVGPVISYTFSSVTNAHSIDAYFARW